MLIQESKPVTYALLSLALFLIVYTALDFTFHLSLDENDIVDFHCFYTVGEMYWAGWFDRAYHYASLFEAQERFFGARGFMPWTYPPQFGLLVAALALLPIGFAYLIFTATSFALYCFVLWRLSGKYFGVVLLSIFPAACVVIRCGQNGFLTAALLGLFCLAFLRGSAAGGLPLGLMVVKPHLSVGVGVLALASRQWKTAAIAAFVFALSSVVATILFGKAVWPAFISGVMESGEFLRLGAYPLFRMTSLYSALHTLGVPPLIALIAQLLTASCALALVLFALLKKWDVRRLAGIAALASIYVSPYIYDYDMAVLGIAIALLIPDVFAHASDVKKALLLFLSWVVCGSGLLIQVMSKDSSSSSGSVWSDQSFSPASFALLMILVMLLIIVVRAQRIDAELAQANN